MQHLPDWTKIINRLGVLCLFGEHGKSKLVLSLVCIENVPQQSLFTASSKCSCVKFSLLESDFNTNRRPGIASILALGITPPHCAVVNSFHPDVAIYSE